MTQIRSTDKDDRRVAIDGEIDDVEPLSESGTAYHVVCRDCTMETLVATAAASRRIVDEHPDDHTAVYKRVR